MQKKLSADQDFFILYGSQTNTAKYAAEEMGRESLKKGLKATIMSCDAFPVFQLPTQRLVVFIVATTGEGECPSSMQNTWKFLLRADLPAGSLKNLNFAVFGLGDSSYELFNAMAIKATKRLLDLGAAMVLETGLGDYQHDFEYQGEFDPWMEQLWPKLQDLVPSVRPLPESDILPPIFKVELLGRAEESFAKLGNLPAPLGACTEPVYITKVQENQRITSETHFQDTRHLVLDLARPDLEYGPGDIIMVQPKNDQQAVEQFIKRLGYEPDQLVKISVDEQQIGQLDQSSLLAFPDDGLTLLELFCFWINLMEPPSRYFMQVLSSFVEDDLHRQKLEEFCSKTVDGKSEYYRYCIRERRTVIEALFDFQPTRITLPLAYLIQLCGRQRPREFSISSAMSKHPGEAHVTMAVTEYTTKFKREKKGICSYWLSRQMSEQNDPIPVWLKKGSFTFPSAIETPLIMVGPGTGLAAFRSFIQHFQNTARPLILIFGCRSQTDDFYYAEEWPQVPNLKVFTAFSRAQESKQYVQHIIKENSALISDLIVAKNAHIYVSGRAKLMPQSVEKAFLHVLSSIPNPAEYLSKMKKDKRYQQEVW